MIAKYYYLITRKLRHYGHGELLLLRLLVAMSCHLQFEHEVRAFSLFKGPQLLSVTLPNLPVCKVSTSLFSFQRPTVTVSYVAKFTRLYLQKGFFSGVFLSWGINLQKSSNDKYRLWIGNNGRISCPVNFLKFSTIECILGFVVVKWNDPGFFLMCAFLVVPYSEIIL